MNSIYSLFLCDHDRVDELLWWVFLMNYASWVVLWNVMILDVNNVDVFIERYMIECSNMNCDGIRIIVVSVYILWTWV